MYGKRAKELEILPTPLSSWYEGRVAGWMWQCWFPLPWGMSWCVVGLYTQGPLCSCFSGSLSAVNRRQLETAWKSSETGGKCHTSFCCWTLLPPWLHLPVLAGVCREKRNPQGFSCCFRSFSQKIIPVKSGLFAELCLWIFVQWRLSGRWSEGSNYWGEIWGPGVPRAAWWEGKSP